MSPQKLAGIVLPYFFFLLLYFQVFFADYAYLDEIHQLWYNDNGNNFTMFFTQGRWITAIAFNKIFAALSSIEALMYVRLLSLGGGILFLLLWQLVFPRWVRSLQMDGPAALLTSTFIACGASTAIYIGWGSCFEVFFGLCAALLSGHCYFSQLQTRETSGKINYVIVVLSVALGIISLFTYQNTFGIFLFPFFMLYVNKGSLRPARIVVSGILFYLFVYVVYYLLFRYSLTLYPIAGNERVGITSDILKKISFLFSDPLPRAFSMNILYTSRNIFPQIFAPAMMIAWVAGCFIRYKARKTFINILYLLFILCLLVLVYLPSMIAKESFASYRTLFVFNLAVFYLIADTLYYFSRNKTRKKLLPGLLVVWLVLTGFYNYNYQFIYPLKTEYKAFRKFIEKNFEKETNTIYFIRPEKFLFTENYGTKYCNDEFGAPSTHRDWVTEPLSRQVIYELTGDRLIAKKLRVMQYNDRDEFNRASIKLTEKDMLIDMNILFADYIRQLEKN